MVCDLLKQSKAKTKGVLILILLEYGLRLLLLRRKDWRCIVLILILLEYGLRLAKYLAKAMMLLRLNPYSIGIWSATRMERNKW